jgi:hypothetical protein
VLCVQHCRQQCLQPLLLGHSCSLLLLPLLLLAQCGDHGGPCRRAGIGKGGSGSGVQGGRGQQGFLLLLLLLKRC